MKNKIFVNKINKIIHNNQEYYDISDITEEKTPIINNQAKSDLTINEKIDNLLKRNGYIFNVNVRIITTKGEYDTRIAGKIDNHLITLDNKIIHISDIKDIVILE